MIKGRVLITGGAGFIGRGLMRQAIRERWPCQFTVLSRDELKQDLCSQRYPNAEYVLGDVRDVEKLTLMLKYHDVCIHAAAAKYVPQSAYNVHEFIDCNIGGSRSVTMAALASKQLTCVVNLSTDKAVQPANVYGMTKGLTEHIFLEAARYPVGPRFVQTRYGNVIGSTGSVVPMFKMQQEKAGYVQVTDPNSTRFWLTVEEAVELIDYAVNYGGTGELIIPNARAMRLATLVDAVCPGVRQEIIGLRPGEKAHESLVSFAESVKTRLSNDLSSGKSAYVYHPDQARAHGKPFEVTSEGAELITGEEFSVLAKEAELV